MALSAAENPGDSLVTGACPQCGTPAAGGARYCSVCGEPVGDPARALAGTAAAARGSRGRPHRQAFLLGAVAAIVTLGILVAAVRLLAGGGGSSSVAADAHLWPASVETASLADCGRTNPPQENYCGCALDRVEAHVSEPAYRPLAQ